MHWPICLTWTKTLRINLYNVFGRGKFDACGARIALEELMPHAENLSARGCFITAHVLTTCHKQVLEKWDALRKEIEPELETASRKKTIAWTKAVVGFSEAFKTLSPTEALLAEANPYEEQHMLETIAELKGLVDAHVSNGFIPVGYESFKVPRSTTSFIPYEDCIDTLKNMLSACELAVKAADPHEEM